MLRNIYLENDAQVEEKPSEDNSSFLLALYLITVTMTILLFGLTMLYSTSSGTAGNSFASYFIRQIIWASLGFAGALTINIIGYKTLSSYSLVFILISAFLLALADFCFPPINGAHRWIKIPGVGNIQPSEYSKLALTLFMARYCSENMRFMNSLFSKKGLFPAVLVCGLILGLIFLGKDWGTTLLLGSVIMMMLFIAGLKIRFLVLPFLMLPALFYYLKNYDAERWSRLTTYLNPELTQRDDGYQLWHSLLALGSGFWTGLGFMESRMKQKYLPESHTDFILSIVGEELGFITICCVIIFYLILIFLGVQISIRAKTKQGLLLGSGITAMIGLQALINIGVVSGAFPTKGMPAPLISYGGSNLVVCLCGIGFLVNIALESSNIDIKKKIPILNKIAK